MPRSGRSPSASTGELSRIGVKGPDRLLARSGAPYLVPIALAAAAVVALWLGWTRLVAWGGSVESPETQIRKALANQDRAQLADVYGFRAGGTVELHPVQFDDVTPSVDHGRATVVAMLRAEGRVAWRDEQANLAYIGRERFHMKPCSIALWCGEGDQFERLRGVLLALFRLHDADQRRDADAYGRLLSADYHDRGEDRSQVLRRIAGTLVHGAGTVRVEAWQIRVERASAEVGEDVEVTPPGAASRRERRVYRLEREGDRWVFAGGV